MPAINGVKKSPVKDKKGGNGTSVVVLILAVVVAIIGTLTVTTAYWKFGAQEQMYSQILQESEVGKTKAYKASRDIASGESMVGAVEIVNVPGNLVVSNMLSADANLTDLKASGNIMANEIITKSNTYDPAKQDVTIGSTKQYKVSSQIIDTSAVNAGDFVDIRLKIYQQGNADSYTDYVVCSKKEVLTKDANGSIEVKLNGSEILNLNNAIVEAQGREKEKSAELYLTKYVDPANQPKAEVTYSGKGSSYIEPERQETQEVLSEMNNGNEVYSAPVVESLESTN